MKYFNKNDIKNIKSYNFDFIELFELNHILTVTLNRPKKKNALHPQMINEIAFAFQYASYNDNIRALNCLNRFSFLYLVTKNFALIKHLIDVTL